MTNQRHRPPTPLLPPSESIEGLAAKDPYDLLSAEQRRQIKQVLEDDARARRRAAARTATLRFG